jgi:glycosyltransferase involved in cell wall biosynthesis
MSRSVWIVIPTYNELENIERSASAACRELERVAPGSYRVLIVDDSSPDGTGAAADRPSARVSDRPIWPALRARSRRAPTSCSRWTPTCLMIRPTSAV